MFTIVFYETFDLNGDYPCLESCNLCYCEEKTNSCIVL